MTAAAAARAGRSARNEAGVYLPQLDGIRAVAVLLVMVTHVGLAGGAGWVGVTMFFVLSGYLITRLLVGEAARTGRIDLVAFYIRRAGRLLPALVAVVVIVTSLNLLRGTPSPIADGLASLVYVSSWFAAGGEALPGLSHTWSLSVEEQFYLVWPIILIATAAEGRVRLAVAIALAVGVASALWRDALVVSGAPWQRYAYGPDAETDGLMAGCAIALATLDRSWRPSRLVIVAAFAAIAAAALSQAGGIALQATVGIPLAIVATGILVLAAVAGDIVVLGWRPLVGLGVISYGLYVWGSPIFGFGETVLAGVSPLVRLPILAVLSVVVAAASYRWLERPIRERARARVSSWRLAPSPAT